MPKSRPPVWTGALAALLPAVAAAGDLSVTPVRLALAPRRPVATMTVRNAGDDPTTLQMRVFAWSQKDGEDQLEPTQEVLANPGGFELAPGASQLARFGLRPGAGAGDRSYRVLVQETPRADTAKPGQIATLLRISIPIFLEDPAAKPALAWALRRDAKGELTLEAANTGAAHVQITRLTLTPATGPAAYAQAVSVYVLPGARRRIAIHPAHPVAHGETLVLKAETDGPALDATLRAEGPADDLAAR